MMAGLHIGVRSNHGGALYPVIAQLPSSTQFSASPVVDRLYSIADAGDAEWRGMRRFHLLYADGVLVSRTLKKEELADALDADLRLFVAEWATDRLFVHAGVVGWQGRALVLPGASMSGKTSLVRALLRAGATYYSDDCALLDDEGRVHSFALPLSIRGEGGARATRSSAEALGAVTGTDPLPVGLIAFTRYRAGSAPRPKGLFGGEATLELLRFTAAARRQPQRSLATLARTVDGARVVKGVRGEADGYAQLLLAMLASVPSRPRHRVSDAMAGVS